jgi:putative cell wall-binding protein
MFIYIVKQSFSMRKWLVFAMILLAATNVSSQGLFIVTTNDVVDMSLSKVLAAASGATIVDIEKGMYDEFVVQRIADLRPEKVVIVGDSSRVVMQFEMALRNHGIPIKRISGRNDTEKSITLYSEFKPLFQSKAVVIVGKEAMAQAVSFAASRKCPLFITDARGLRNLLAIIKGQGIKEYTLFSSNKQGDLKEEARRKIETATTLIDEVFRKIEILRQKEANITQVSNHLSTCKTTFNVALKAYEEGDLLRALQFLDETLGCLEELNSNLNEVIENIGVI